MATGEEARQAILDGIVSIAPSASAEALRNLAEAWQLLQTSDDDEDEED